MVAVRIKQQAWHDDPNTGCTEPDSPLGIAFAENVTPVTYHDPPSHPSATAGPFMTSGDAPKRRRERPPHHRKRPDDHIPRPPNAFILYRSWCIKGGSVPESVETNHSVISKIIGRMWKALPKAERDVWSTRARVALEEHRARYPKYSFRPSLPKREPGCKRKVREMKPKDEVRCAKIAELLAEGKTGEELNRAVEEFDRHHVPEIVTRFDAPLTETAYQPSGSEPPEVQRAPPIPAKRKPRASSTRSSRASSTAVDRAKEAKPLPQHPVHNPYPEISSPLPKEEPIFPFGGFSFEAAATPMPELEYASALCRPTDTSSPFLFPSDVAMPEPRRMLSIDTTFLRDWSTCASPVSSIDSSSPATPYVGDNHLVLQPARFSPQTPSMYGMDAGLSVMEPTSYLQLDRSASVAYENSCDYETPCDLATPYEGYTPLAVSYETGEMYMSTSVPSISLYPPEPIVAHESQEHDMGYSMYMSLPQCPM
ncbi:hypothetical protein HGRIS_004373 [Hohenbuehelia grisea]|uniref:HMG box domain-containing protein n=1 Tax=Hohenbuehelia grisea TaxID=104357 RepID=A0ABR3JCA5_9AGAR